MTPDRFPAFFEALWGYPPFAWQTRLLKRVVAEGWPSTLDLPTGSGKTAALDVALFALALDAFEAPERRRQARRIVLVVDRRVVVDQAYVRAVEMATKLDAAKDGILADVAGALRRLSGYPDGLPVVPAILRGGMPRETDWANAPSQPVILVSTVDQVGSRLLFRGYGVSHGMRSVHAGLLGHDALYLLDEVHLARPFEETLAAIATSYGGTAGPLPRPLVFVRMSATVTEERDDGFFGLEDADREHETLDQRLGANKRAVLRQVNAPRDPVKAGEAIARAAVREVERLAQGSPRAIAVIVNRVSTAGQIAALAEERLKDWTVSLLTGRMRPLDRAEKQAEVFEGIRSGRNRDEADERVLLVSTQAVEAGADFDFDALVTECASLDALRQRFGRLDRGGYLKKTDAVVLAASSSVDEKSDPDPVYGDALRETWRWLNAIGEMSEEHDVCVVDFGIDALAPRLSELTPEVLKSLLPPRTIAPVLTMSHLDRWVQTSPAPSADPEVAPFLHGPDRGTPEVQIVWRADLDDVLLNEEHLWLLRGMLETVRPSALEALSVPLWEARRWLTAVAARLEAHVPDAALRSSELTDVEGAAGAGDDPPEKVAPVVLWRGDKTQIGRKSAEIFPGDTLVVPSTYGGLDARFCCWAPEAVSAVPDRGDEAQLLQRGRAVLRWHPAVVQAWGGQLSGALAVGPQVSRADIDERGRRAERDAFQAWRKAVLEEEAVPAWARVALEALAKRLDVCTFEVPASAPKGVDDTRLREGGSDEELAPWRASWQAQRVSRNQLQSLRGLPTVRAMTLEVLEAGAATTEDDEGSFLGSPFALSEHLAGVRDFAAAFARALALPEPLRDDLALAGWLHDLGKADPRFQLMLHGGDPVREATASEFLAKSVVSATDPEARERARRRSGYPVGTRHELMSVALIEGSETLRARAHDWDLVLHLVASHHGWCRPFAPLVLDPDPVEVKAQIGGVELLGRSDHGLSRIDAGVVERFWRLVRRYGWWGLAWLEAIVRLADHRESEREAYEAERKRKETKDA